MRKSLLTISLTGLLLFPSTSLALDKSKVLSTSAETYVKSRGESLSDYILIGIHSNSDLENCLTNLIEDSPSNTKVITDYKLSATGFGGVDRCYGTALIPQKE